MFRRTRPNQLRRGTATIELAVSLPILVTIIFGAIETANFIQLKHSLTLASYEAAKVVTTGTQQDAESRVQSILKVRHVNNYNVSFSPAVDEQTLPGTTITVSISTTDSTHSISVLKLFTSNTLQVTATGVRM